MGRRGKKTTSRSGPLTMQQRFVRWCFRPQRLVPAALLATLALFWPQLMKKLPALESREEYQVTLDRITVTPAPRWVPEDLVEDVLHRVGLDAPLSLQEPTLSERIAAAFVTHPWIEEVHRVKKSYPARVHVELTYRRPVAIVRGMDGAYPVDALGVVLPGNDFRQSDVSRYPVIEKVTSIPQAGQGQPWGDSAVTGAAQLASLLMEPIDSGRSRWEAWGLTAIEAPSTLGLPGETPDMTFVLRTTGGSTVIWGREPDSIHPGEFTVEQKLERMAEYHLAHGSFDDAPEPYEFDLRPWNGIGRRLATGSTAVRR